VSCPHGEWHSEDCEVCQKEDELYARIAEMKAELRLAFEDAYPLIGDTYDGGGIYRKWLADLRARAEMVPARGPDFGDDAWERRQDNPPSLGLINDVVPPDRVSD